MPESASDLPMLTRRDFWRVGAVSVTGAALAPLAGPLRAAAGARVEPRGGAECVIFLNLVGGPSQMDTFDVKEYKFTPQDLDIRTLPLGYRWPFGLLPKTAGVLEDVAIVRSMAAWESVHNLAQYGLQVGHPFTAARAKELPCIGSVIAYESLGKGKESDYLPPFVSMNFPAGAVNGTLIREGFLDSAAAPLALDMRKGGSMPFLLPEENRARFNRRLDFLRSFDTSRELESVGTPKLYREWDSFSKSAEKMIKSPQVAGVFALKEDERKRYGGSPFGDACQIARNMVAARAGVRYILVNQGGWDHHGDIYGKKDAARMEDPRMRGGLYTNCADLDSAYAALIAGLEADEVAGWQLAALENAGPGHGRIRPHAGEPHRHQGPRPLARGARRHVRRRRREGRTADRRHRRAGRQDHQIRLAQEPADVPRRRHRHHLFRTRHRLVQEDRRDAVGAGVRICGADVGHDVHR